MSYPNDNPKVLTSWKEIAAYLGKGVRTVQRWEMRDGLPVHRPMNSPKGTVRACKQELDEWFATHWPVQQDSSTRNTSEVEELRKKVSQLESANALLQQALLRQERALSNAGLSAVGELSPDVDSLIRRVKDATEHCSQIMARTEALHQRFAETLDITRNMRALRAHSGWHEQFSVAGPTRQFPGTAENSKSGPRTPQPKANSQ